MCSHAWHNGVSMDISIGRGYRIRSWSLICFVGSFLPTIGHENKSSKFILFGQLDRNDMKTISYESIPSSDTINEPYYRIKMN